MSAFTEALKAGAKFIVGLLKIAAKEEAKSLVAQQKQKIERKIIKRLGGR